MDQNLNENEEFYVTLVLEDDTELTCAVIAKFPLGENMYIILEPDRVIDGYEEGDVFIYRCIEHEDGELDLIPIESEEEYEAVADAFDELLDEEEFNNMSSEE